MIEANKYKLGIFVLTGIALLIIGLFVLGLSESFKSKINFMTYFNESVQGLDTGSEVKFRGVTIGKVTRIAIRPDDNLIRVDMQAIPSSIEPTQPGTEPVDFFNKLENEVRRGLRCRMELTGITGTKYVEMDYIDPKKSHIIEVTPPEKTFYIPSTPSLLEGLRSNVTLAIAKIANIDFEKIYEELASTLKSANKILSDPKITKTINKVEKVTDNLAEITENIQKSFNKKRIENLSTELQDSLNSFKTFSKKAKDELNKSNLPSTAQSIRQAKEEISITLEKMDKTLDAMTELINTIDQDPSSLLRGKQSPE